MFWDCDCSWSSHGVETFRLRRSISQGLKEILHNWNPFQCPRWEQLNQVSFFTFLLKNGSDIDWGIGVKVLGKDNSHWTKKPRLANCFLRNALGVGYLC